MEEIKKELVEIKEAILKLLELQLFEHKIKYGYMERPLDNISNRKN